MNEALGSMGGAADGLIAPIKQTFRPDVDPNDPESLRRAAQYQTGVGEQDAARLYTIQAKELAEKQRKEEERRKQGIVAKQLSTVKAAIESGTLTPEQMSAMEQGLIANATDAGMDATKLVGISQKIVDEKLARETQRIQADALRNEAADKAAISALSAKIAAATDAEELDKIISNAGNYSTEAQQLANSRLSWLETRKSLEQKAVDMSTPIDTSAAEDLLSKMPDSEREALEPLLNNLKTTQEKGFVNGTWVSPTSKSGAQAQYNALLSRMGEVAINNAVNETSALKAEQRKKEAQVETLRLSLMSAIPDEDVNRRARMGLGVDKKGKAILPTEEDLAQARAELRAERQREVEQQIAFLQGIETEKPEAEMADDGGFSVKTPDGNVITKEYALRAKESGKTPKQLADATGISLEQAEMLMGRSVQASKGKTQEELITEGGLINPYRARKKLGLPIQ